MHLFKTTYLDGGGMGLVMREGFLFKGDSVGDKIVICGEENSRILAVKPPPPTPAAAAGLANNAPNVGPCPPGIGPAASWRSSFSFGLNKIIP